MQTTNERVRSKKNNDPLAHVYLLWDSYDSAIAEHRMYTEFVTDMGERLKDQPFRSSYDYTYSSQEITYNTGLRYIASLEHSYQAAKADVSNGSFSTYHIDRQAAFKRQGEVLLNWLHDENGSPHLLLASLCPSEDELSFDEAKKQSFNPNRLMASLQLHSKNSDGTATTTAFSLDGLSLQKLQMLCDNVGLTTSIAATTLEQVAQPIAIYTDASVDSVVDTIIATYDAQLSSGSIHEYKQGILLDKKTVEANSFVASHPETFALYKTVIEQVAESLHNQTVQESLATTVRQQLKHHYANSSLAPSFLNIHAGDYFTSHMASELIDYLRKRAIPEYLTKLLQEPTHNYRSSSSDIGSAGVIATQSGRVYDGACPSSVDGSAEQATVDQAMRLGLNVAVTLESPKPLFIVGNYAVIPIGSCPASCGTECGIGIKDIRSGHWYCANSKRCSGYNNDVYNYVFHPAENASTSMQEESIHQENNGTQNIGTPDIGIELRATQSMIWQLRSLMFNETLVDSERQDIITNLISADQRKQHLLRVALGREAYIEAEELRAA